ncbi:helix-turn-helix domain-containing protein [Psychroserpens ponticola]|uniref:LuxR C-terminal-related transcriptional regulator n=1 Tax=Psychroserpens ponticola TaxID=2932268 RepID=A0ABY7RWH6_9FLAO|nr:LuxR C-terminal-related transcriptional regulator [Psychroserpens ponticola]WCO01041.1 LuxR C-terminal-related transcriptional regulator [Psychroserpens ponticola]
MRYLFLIASFIFFGNTIYAQHIFDGYIDNERWQSDVYLSVIEDYRTLDGINDEQIITKVNSDDSGYFQFKGNQLDSQQKIYKLHVDNCDTYNQSSNHFDGHCADSRDILFIAKNTDSITFPLSFEAQMFCDIISNNPKTACFIKIDSLKEEMKFAYTEFRSKANRDLNNKKWFKSLQDYGEELNEPLAELYIYTFLSDRSNQFHNYYLEDLKNNSYYDELLNRLKNQYPNSSYTKQYEAELTSDKFILSPTDETKDIFWIYVLISVTIISIALNFWLLYSAKKRKTKQHTEAKEQLTKQEQNVLDLLLSENTNKDIAETLFVSVSTVKTHVNNVYKKLNVNSRDELKSLFDK